MIIFAVIVVDSCFMLKAYYESYDIALKSGRF